MQQSLMVLDYNKIVGVSMSNANKLEDFINSWIHL